MQKVGKRNRRNLSRGQKILVYGFSLVLGFSLLLLLLLWEKGPAPAGFMEIPQDTAKLHFSAAQDDLQSFTIFPGDGGHYTIVHNQGVYSLEEDPDYSLDLTVIDGMVQSLLYLQSTDTIGDATGLDLKEFGLAEGALQVMAQYTQGRQIHFTIGGRVPSDIPSDYLLIAGDPLLYAIGVDVREAFDYKLNQLHTIPAININAGLLDQIHFVGEGAFSLRRVAEDIWEISDPVKYPANLTQVQWLLRQISQMRLAAYIAPSSTENLVRYGLEKPRSHVVFSLAESMITSMPADETSPVSQKVAAQELVIAIGDDIPGLGFYCLYNDVIYQASNLSMGFLPNHDMKAYFAQNPVDIPLGRPIRLTAFLPEGSIDCSVSLVEHILQNNDIALDEQGNILYDYLIISAGREVTPARFIDAYTTLMAIEASGYLLPGFSAQGKPPALSLSLSFENQQRHIAFYPYDALHFAAEINGHFIHFVSRQSVETAAFALAALTD